MIVDGSRSARRRDARQVRSALRRRHRRAADDRRGARHRRLAASRRRAFAVAAAARRIAARIGATPCSRSSTTASAARAACWAAACAIAARSWCAPANGNTCTGKDFVRSSSISRDDPLEQSDLGADPAIRSRSRADARAAFRLARDVQAADDGRRRAGRGAHRRASGARHPHRHLVRQRCARVRGPLHGHDTRHRVSCLAAAASGRSAAGRKQAVRRI